ncbi:MAG: CHAD domain-containing protein [Negativicutes bacterium]
MMNKTMEMELKLRILASSMWKTLPKDTWLRELMVEDSAKTQILEATYYDTPSRTLWGAGYAFRIRKEETGWIATLKETGKSGGGLHQRREWNEPVLGSEASLGVFDRMSGAEKVVKLLHQDQAGLAPLFKMTFTRWSVLVHPLTGVGLLELVMDKGFIHAGDTEEKLFETKIELKEGIPKDLLAFGAELSRRYPLMPEERSKYSRGMRLAELQTVLEENGMNPWPSTVESFLAEAVALALKTQTAFYSNPESDENLHDLRIAMRKLRSRLSFAAPLYPAEEGLKWKEVFRAWSRHMAPIRDLDMLQDELSVAAGVLGVEDLNSNLRAYIKNRRDILSEAFYKTIEKGKLTADLLTFWSWTAGEAMVLWTHSDWTNYFAQRLRRRLKQFGQQLKKVDISNVAAMHGLRISGKKARYILERYAQHDETRDTMRLAAELKQLQEGLGEMQDSVQGTSSLNQLEQDGQEEKLAREIAFLAGWQTRRGYDSRQKFGLQKKEFRKILKRWLRSRT